MSKWIEKPFLAVVVVTAGVGVDATEERSPDASGNAVINADLIIIDDVAAGVGRHRRLRRLWNVADKYA
jgi:hypothetical protein